MSVGSRIKEKRQSRGLSRPELADRLKITVSAVSNYENGISFPKEPILIKIMDVLDCDANFIFQDVIRARSAGDNALSPSEQALVDNYRALDPEGKTALSKYAEFLASSSSGSNDDSQDQVG